MIANLDGEKITPKEAAREIIMGKLDGLMLNPEGAVFSYQGKATAREKDLIEDQLSKEVNRIARHFGWDEQY